MAIFRWRSLSVRKSPPVGVAIAARYHPARLGEARINSDDQHFGPNSANDAGE